MKTFFLFIFFFFSINILYSQEIPELLEPTQRVTFGNKKHTSRDALFFSKKDSRGNLIIAGFTERDFSFTDVKIMSFDNNLNLLWSDRLSWDGISYDYPMDILIDKDDYVWVISKNVYTNSQANFVVSRYSPKGEKLWEYISPETVETSTLNMNQYFYFFDEEGYLRFNYVKGKDHNGLHTFFRLSPSGKAVDKYQVNMRLFHLSQYQGKYRGLKFDEEEWRLSYVIFDEEEVKESYLELSEQQLYTVVNSIYEGFSKTLTDNKGNLIYISQGKIHSDDGKRHEGIIIFSVTPSGELNYFLDDSSRLNKYLLGHKIVSGNNLVVVSNSQPLDSDDEEPILTIETFSQNGELISIKKSNSATGNIIQMEDERVLVRTLNGDLSIYDYELNLISDYPVEPTGKYFNPQGIHLIKGSPVLVGTTLASRYQGSDYSSERNYLIRKFDKNGVSAKFHFNGEGTSKLFAYHMIRDEKGNILTSADEFLGPSNLGPMGSRAPRETKVLTFSPDLKLVAEDIVDRNYELWKDPGLVYTTSNGEKYRYEISEDERAIEFYIDDQHQWTRELNFIIEDGLYDSGMKISYANTVDNEGNVLITSSRYGSGAGRLHKITPDNEYKMIETGGHMERSIILSNNWLFTYFSDYSIKVYSPNLALISSKEYNKNFFFGDSTPILIEKNNKALFNITHNNLVLVFDQYGRYENQFAIEGFIHPNTAFFDENETLNVYHTIGNGLYTEHGHNWSRGAISRYANIVEDFIGSLSKGDSDGDGVNDFIDQCPDTEAGVRVDEFGCPLLQLPYNNFKIFVKNETCLGKKNGLLKVKAIEDHQYLLGINDEEYSFESEFSKTALAPGNYEVWIKVAGEEQTKQFFQFEIEQGQAFDAQAKIIENHLNNKISVQVSKGTAPFSVTVNGMNIGEFNTSVFEIPVKNGNMVEVFSALPCEGKLQVQVNLRDHIQLSRNPVVEVANITLPFFVDKPVWVEIFNVSGQRVQAEYYYPENSKNLEIDTSHLPSGMYYALVQLEKSYTIKIMKE